jgi:hypothetical protein
MSDAASSASKSKSSASSKSSACKNTWAGMKGMKGMKGNQACAESRSPARKAMSDAAWWLQKRTAVPASSHP